MTECAPLISFTPADRFVPKSSGEVIPVMEAKIIKADPETGIGEICVRGENLMSGYYKNPKLQTVSLMRMDGCIQVIWVQLINKVIFLSREEVKV